MHLYFAQPIKFFKTGGKTFSVQADIFYMMFAGVGLCSTAAFKNSMGFKFCGLYVVCFKKGNG